MGVRRTVGAGRARRIGAVGFAVATALALSACGSSTTTGSTAFRPPERGAPAAPSPSAPSAFGRAVPLGTIPAPPGDLGRHTQRVPAVLDGTTAYLADPSRVRVVDATDGRQLATVAPRNQVLVTGGEAADLVHPPVLTTVHGAPSVVWPFLVGTSAGPSVELVTIDTRTHSATSATVRLPGWASTSGFNLSVSPVGADGDTIALNVSGGLYHALLAVDAGTGAPRWSRDDFTAAAVSGATVAGAVPDSEPATTEHLVGLSLADGHQLWAQLHGYGLDVQPAGPNLVAASGQLATGVGRGMFKLLSATTGASVADLPVGDGVPSSCLYDQTSVTVCEAPTDNLGGSRVAVAVDARTGRQLWSLPDSDTGAGPVPLFTAGWHGVFYAVDPSGGTVTYRADTGSAVRNSPGPAPTLVNDHAGVAVTADGGQLVGYAPDSSRTP